MRITRLVLKNWGPHKQLDLDMDTPVFGLLGPNASGKSNIMSAIAFGFTGMLDNNQASYVRNASGEEISNGSVDLYFVKGGTKGRIFRQVGKSPSRTLWWEDWSNPIKKAADIDKMMNQILDCDKKAIDQAVFLSQGHLADFLTGTPTQREEDFSRMCLIDHLSMISDIAAQEALRLSKTVTDLTSQRDEALLSKDQATDALRTAESELELHPDRTVELRWLTQLKTLMETADTAEQKGQSSLASLTAAREKLAAVLCPAFSSPDTANEDFDNLNRSLTESVQASHELKALLATWEQQQTHTSRLVTVRAEMAAAVNASTQMPQLQARVDSAEATIAAARAWDTWKASYDSWKQRKDSCDASVAAGHQAVRALASLESVEERIRLAQADLETLAAERFRLSLAEQAQGHVHDCCPLCKGKDLGGLPSGEELARLKASCEAGYAASQAVLTEAQQEKVKRARYQERLDSLLAQQQLLIAEEPPQFDGSQVGVTELAEAREDGAKAAQELVRIRAELGKVPKFTAEIQTLTDWIERSQMTQEVFEAQKAALTSKTEQNSTLVDQTNQLDFYLRNRDTLERSVNACAHTLEVAAAEASAARSNLEEYWTTQPSTILLTARDFYSLETCASQIKERQAERERVQGMIRANTDALRRAENRVAEIEQRVQQNAATMSVIGHLEELKGAFGRQGVPRHYLSKVFDALLTSTQENLAEWDTDFQVEKDPDNLFNFQFYRTNDPDTLMDQSQLSGGQRTRLALSFVQAVQHLLYPGLDFLCVDEPSNHLDAEGVEGLVRLFQTIASQNQCGEAQVIVVDHNPLLHRAFSKSVTLTRLRETEAA